jgi:hypothetical protein
MLTQQRTPFSLIPSFLDLCHKPPDDILFRLKRFLVSVASTLKIHHPNIVVTERHQDVIGSHIIVNHTKLMDFIECFQDFILNAIIQIA